MNRHIPTPSEAWHLIQQSGNKGISSLPPIVRDAYRKAGRLSYHSRVDQYTFKRCYKVNVEMQKNGTQDFFFRDKMIASRELRRMREMLSDYNRL